VIGDGSVAFVATVMTDRVAQQTTTNAYAKFTKHGGSSTLNCVPSWERVTFWYTLPL